MLTPEQVAQYHEQGFLCLPDFLSRKQIDQMKQEATKLLDQLDITNHPMTQFKTDDNDHIGDQYFFDSSDKVSYFFDTDAFDSNGKLQFPKEQAINKIGHGLHMHNKIFEDITLENRVSEIAKVLDYTDPRVLQSMLIFKQPVTSNDSERDNAVPPHTDATFLYTDPQSAVGFWYALEDCTEENGCLYFVPGSHKQFPICKRFVKVNGGKGGCNFIPLSDKCDPTAIGNAILEIPESNYVPVKCPAGSLVLIHNSVLHKSHKNRSTKSRYAYAFHMIDGTAKYDHLNWLQVPPTGGTNFTKVNVH
ncbi:uncharacterized protein KQ657_003665 [Scheffersomyces spartinae]|uniref:Phytanoyl-CoA dioxygenase n=1 Tax=Scheffersomyces spartinae TaxID=45513 RepID=A0A9P7VD58_9ASCO|nr:uncharacterized protein KQ657_003665 [Scheffersomyces spartinae]KAG7195144.1 hypothetical protein KQ657_003665 [Scheffersomyces spartinae]